MILGISSEGDNEIRSLWRFQPVDNIIRKESISQERILITDKCRVHNFPKPFTTYQIVSVEDTSVCLGVHRLSEEQNCLRVLPCHRLQGRDSLYSSDAKDGFLFYLM